MSEIKQKPEVKKMYLAVLRFDAGQCLQLAFGSLMLLLGVAAFVYDHKIIAPREGEDHQFFWSVMGTGVIVGALFMVGFGGFISASDHGNTVLAKSQLNHQHLSVARVDVTHDWVDLRVGACRPRMRLLRINGVYHAYLPAQTAQGLPDLRTVTHQNQQILATMSTCRTDSN